MTPAEHYAEAERMLLAANRIVVTKANVPMSPDEVMLLHGEVANMFAVAQVHATLALYRPEPTASDYRNAGWREGPPGCWSTTIPCGGTSGDGISPYDASVVIR